MLVLEEVQPAGKKTHAWQGFSGRCAKLGRITSKNSDLIPRHKFVTGYII